MHFHASATECAVYAQVIPVLILAGILEKRTLDLVETKFFDVLSFVWSAVGALAAEVIALQGVDHGHAGSATFLMYAGTFSAGSPLLALVVLPVALLWKARRRPSQDDPPAS